MKTVSRFAAPFVLAAAVAGCSDAPNTNVVTTDVLKTLHTQDVGRYALVAISATINGPNYSDGIVGTQQALIVKIGEFKNDNALTEYATPAKQLCSMFNLITTTLRDDGELIARYGNFDSNIDVVLDLSGDTAIVEETAKQDGSSATYKLQDSRKETYCTYTPKAQ